MVNNRIDVKNHLSSSAGNAITSYITNVSTMNESAAHQYLARLKDFENFITKMYELDVDSYLFR